MFWLDDGHLTGVSGNSVADGRKCGVSATRELLMAFEKGRVFVVFCLSQGVGSLEAVRLTWHGGACGLWLETHVSPARPP